MKLRNILATVAIMGMIFASKNSTDILGYTEGDYSDYNTFPHKAAGLNVAYTNGMGTVDDTDPAAPVTTWSNDFTAMWTDGGTTWGFASGGANDLVDMVWSNGTFGVTLGMEMLNGSFKVDDVCSDPTNADCDNTVANTLVWTAPNCTVVDGTEDCTDVGEDAVGSCSDGGVVEADCNNGTANTLTMGGGAAAAAGDTNFRIGFGMDLMGWDVGFKMGTADNSTMSLNARGSLGFWAFDTMEVNYASNDATTWMGFRMYSVNDWGPATGFFAMGLDMDTDNPAHDTVEADDGSYVSGWADDPMLLTTDMSVASTLTDWCDLRIGYSKSFNLTAAEGEDKSFDSYSAGVGFNYGSVALDMTLSQDGLGNMVSNPLNYFNGRNDGGLTTNWTLSYTW